MKIKLNKKEINFCKIYEILLLNRNIIYVLFFRLINLIFSKNDIRSLEYK